MPRLIALLVVFLALASAGHGLWQLTAEMIPAPEAPAGEHPDLGIEMDPDGATVALGESPILGLGANPNH